MSKLLLFSDAHIHTHKNSLKRLQHCLDALKWVFETAVERNIKNVVFLGDLFQDRERIQTLPYQRTFEILNQYAGGRDPKVNLYLLIGNHDMWFADRTDVSSVFPLGAITNVRVIRDCETINIGGLDIDFLPFTLNPLESLKAFSKRSKVLCGHLALDGAQLNTFYKTHADISVEYEGDMVKVDNKHFSAWQRVFLGHYHGEQRIGHIEYVGSPLELNFAEASQEKHIIILDTDTLATEYVKNTFSPRHLIVEEDEIAQYNMDNCFVRVHPNDMITFDLMETKSKLEETYNILSFDMASPKIERDVKTQNSIDDAREVFLSRDNKQQMLADYVKAVGIPKDMLFETMLEIGTKICERSAIE